MDGWKEADSARIVCTFLADKAPSCDSWMVAMSESATPRGVRCGTSRSARSRAKGEPPGYLVPPAVGERGAVARHPSMQRPDYRPGAKRPGWPGRSCRLGTQRCRTPSARSRNPLKAARPRNAHPGRAGRESYEPSPAPGCRRFHLARHRTPTPASNAAATAICTGIAFASEDAVRPFRAGGSPSVALSGWSYELDRPIDDPREGTRTP